MLGELCAETLGRVNLAVGWGFGWVSCSDLGLADPTPSGGCVGPTSPLGAASKLVFSWRSRYVSVTIHTVKTAAANTANTVMYLFCDDVYEVMKSLNATIF